MAPELEFGIRFRTALLSVSSLLLAGPYDTERGVLLRLLEAQPGRGGPNFVFGICQLVSRARSLRLCRLNLAFAEMAEKEENSGAWSRCPVWDGSPLTWSAFRRKMAWWCSSLDLEGTKKYNLAARFLLRQTGTVRQRGKEFLLEELEYQKEMRARDPESGEEFSLTPEDPLAGLN